MLKMITAEGGIVLDVDDFYIDHKLNGLDQLVFNIPIYDEHYKNISEETEIIFQQPYLVKAIDAGKTSAKVRCELNLDPLKSTMMVGYTNSSNTLANTVNGVLPAGWLFVDNAFRNIRRTIEGNYTPLDVIMECQNTFNVVMKFEPRSKRVTAYSLDSFAEQGAFATRELNLTEVNYKGKSEEFYTRLYAFGKDGLSFAGINGGRDYVENNDYTMKVICAYWQDERYTDVESLLADAKKRVAAAGIPSRSYECKVIDLAKTNPEMYGFQDFSMYSVIRLIDSIKGISIPYQVIEYKEHPFYPEKNEITLSTAAAKVTTSIKTLSEVVLDGQIDKGSAFYAALETAVSNATDQITGNRGGYVVMHDSDGDGEPDELLIMDRPSISTATKVWRWNQNGLGYSDSGYNGEYGLAITQDGAIVADYITSGTIMANLIKAGVLSDMTGKNYWNLETGEISLSAEAFVDTTNFVTQTQLAVEADRIAAEVSEKVGSGIFYNCTQEDNGDGTTTIYAHVYLNMTEATENYAYTYFRWFKKTENGREFIGYGYDITVNNDEYDYGGEVVGQLLLLEDCRMLVQQGRLVFTQNASSYTLATEEGRLMFRQGQPMVMYSTGSAIGNVYPVIGYDR